MPRLISHVNHSTNHTLKLRQAGALACAAPDRRLVASKDEYDPDNLLRMNQNIKPGKQTADAVAREMAAR
jgi:Berberine and berberine like